MEDSTLLPRHRCNITGEYPDIPRGHCLTEPPLNGVSMLYNTRIFYLNNNLYKPKLATVRRTLQTGAQEDFRFRVNDFNSPGWKVNVLFFAGTDTGSIELVDVIDSPKEGAMDGMDKLQRDVFHGELEALRNGSPHPMYVSVDIYTSDDPQRRRPSLMQLVFKPGQVIPIIGQPEQGPAHLVFHAAELQKSSLYPPYWRQDA